MAFKLLAQPAAPARSDDDDPATAISAAQQMALHLNDGGPVRLSPIRANSPAQLNRHIAYIAGQIEALRQQLRDHSADRIALLLHEMSAERERAHDRYRAQETAWDRRLESIENAVAERDTARQREAALIRERDEARAAAAASAAERDAAQRTAAAARNEAAAVHRIAEGAKAEQVRLRAERELDRKTWTQQRRGLVQQLEGRSDRNWLARLIRA